MDYPILILKPAKESHLKNRHHAIFHTSVSTYPDCEDGSIVQVQSTAGQFLCYAMLNRKAFICGRAIAFTQAANPLIEFEQRIRAAIDLRPQFFAAEDTNACRLVNAEGDGVPGLIVDQYADTLAVQITTLGMDRIRPWIIDVLQRLVKPAAMFEKSAGPGRKKEGLEPREGWMTAKGRDTIEVRERGLKFLISFAGSQKTGLFLDQREMRSLVRILSKGRTVLDVCSYVGGFSLSALKGGAVAAAVSIHI